MEPITHALASLALARAGQKHLPRFGTAMFVAAGIAPDLDYASYLGGAGPFLRFHRTLLHSLPSSILLACVIAGAFCAHSARDHGMENDAKSGADAAGRNLGFGAALAVCAISIAGHLLLDATSGVGVQLLWPFRIHWYALDLLLNLDPWILILLAAGLLLPMLLRMVGEEIGERKKSGGGQRGAIVTLVLVVVYIGARAGLHSRAVDLLDSRDYRGRIALAEGAFPTSSPLDWRGVVSTDYTIEQVDVPLAPGTEFDAERSATRYKPEESPALDAGQRTVTAQTFLKYARFPLASVVRFEDGYRFELLDARFAPDDSGPANIVARVEMRGDYRIASEELAFASGRR